MGIQPAFHEYKAVTCMFHSFPKTEDQCSQAMKQTVQEAFENNIHYDGDMKAIAKAYLST